MGLSRSKTLFLLVWLCLVVLALRRDANIERWIERGFLPARVLERLCLPWRWIAWSRVHAAERAVESRSVQRTESARAALREEQSFALPSIDGLRTDRVLVPAQFIDSVPGVRDARVISFPPDAVVEVGFPVVCGNTYVGRISWLDPTRRGEARVELITGDTFRVGAALMQASDVASSGQSPESSAAGEATYARLVVGGLASSPVEDPHSLYLSVRVESDREIERGLVHVSERDAFDLDPAAKLADGFVLGELVRYSVGGVQTLGVRARLNYQSGLYRAVVLAPASHASASSADAERALDPFEPDEWVEAELSTLPDPAFWREARRLSAGSGDGLVLGSAIAAGAEFVGRVTDITTHGACASLLGDPGLSVHVLASVDGEASPIVLGALVSLGRDDGDVVLMRWEALVAIAPDDGASPTLRAQLFTGAGEREVPPGLVIGTAELPRARGEHTLRVLRASEIADVRRVRAWRDPALVPSVERTP